jgi:hypothetical protein
VMKHINSMSELVLQIAKLSMCLKTAYNKQLVWNRFALHTAWR